MRFLKPNKKLTLMCVLLTVCLCFSGCSWYNKLFKPKANPHMDQALSKIDSLALSNESIDRKVGRIEARFFEMEKRLDSMNGALDRLEASYSGPEPAVEPIAQIQEPIPAPEPLNIEKKAPEPAAPAIKASAPEPAQIPSPEKFYSTAFENYKKGNHSAALKGFVAFLQDNPGHDLADNAQYWIGEINYDKKNYPGAIAAFEQVIEDYPDQPKAPAALLKIAYSWIALGNRENAASNLRKVVTDYPFSKLVAAAREKLDQIRPYAGENNSGYIADVTP